MRTSARHALIAIRRFELPSWCAMRADGPLVAALEEAIMAHYAGLDVSDKDTAIHVVDEAGKLVWRGKRASEPDVIAAALRRHAPELQRVGLETRQLAPWLYHSLRDLGFPVICLDARHARTATALQRNKTDAHDAETLAQLIRTGWYRAARVKGSPCVVWWGPVRNSLVFPSTCRTRSAAR